MLKHFRIQYAVAALLTAAILTGCAGPQPVLPSPTPTVTPPPTGPPNLSDDELYALAVSQYTKLHAIFVDVVNNGSAEAAKQENAVVLPEASHDVMMEPAWTAYNDAYRQALLKDETMVGTPQYTIMAMERLYDEGPLGGAIIALETCEVFHGASTFDKDGNPINSGIPAMGHMSAYFKYDETDLKLKVFVLDGEVVDTCPF